ncbi:MAG: glutamate formimidoyltransferase [Thermanaerothrix sp.]|uniref:Formimidoyltransferase-cyclodeaminase n=1 Tax=Thermanaerothrix solaris TaxID=3058434 RepID=A0ABU3NIU8_9CHLR|nr:glutamate formimidoyltransferase [Thermanaerothrix sp. 4228-RoL]MDT8896712.1 glutamate formimidoyltransferase [Thermanaerothrix sp. 4228-RoL]
MTQPLVECIPNFSEARRPEVVEAIIQAINSVPNVYILDRHSDFDHNRTVITFVGSPQAVEEAAFRAIARAAELIDLDKHTGAHPRIGATDVVPFVPIQDITMQECVEMARRLGKRVGEELQIPVYLYEEAASRPERVNLENIRRGQYEALKEEIATDPEREPDFGPRRVGPAGATVIGARHPLIAFNVYLNTSDVSIAQKIARAIRFSNGGLRYVKAMGVMVEGKAQVSMNLTNFRQTPVFRVMEMIRRECERYGVAVHHSELVGLIPQEALNDSAIWYLQLDGFEPSQILENRLSEVMRTQSSETAPPQETSFLEALAAPTPTPGGGSAAAFTGAMAAALVAMVARLTLSKKKYEHVKPQMWQILEEAEALRHTLLEAVEEDAQAFETVMAALKLPKETPEQESAQQEALQKANLHAAEVPLKVAQTTFSVMELAYQVAALGNLNAITDAASAATLAHSAITCAGYNVRINLSGLDLSLSQPLLDQIGAIENQAAESLKKVRALLRDRGGLQIPD